ncbi:MAG TPA: hypothetical protein VK662_04620 [Acidothermaceae bacterium]|jgi:hypothetical protein|nr:hypothetical protein [Acidothermaceae bacterium]
MTPAADGLAGDDAGGVDETAADGLEETKTDALEMLTLLATVDP